MRTSSMNIENKREYRTQKTEHRLEDIGIFYITQNGIKLAQRLNGLYPDARVVKFKSDAIPEIWSNCRNLIFIMAAGIAIRTIAPLIKDKRIDPAVVVLDEKGKHAISLLSGHLGGANKVAKEVAEFLGGEAIITTASDINNMTSIDLWAEENNLVIEDWALVPQVGTRLINNNILRVFSEIEIKLPDEFLRVAEPQTADILITNKACHSSGSNWMLKQVRHDRNGISDKPLYLRPKNLVIGIGCNSKTSADEIEDAVKGTLEKNNLSFLSIKYIATIDKKGSEPGLISFAGKYNIKIYTFTPDELNSVNNVEKSENAFKATGAKGVAEPAAILASGASKLLVPKHKIGNVTIAIADCDLRIAELKKRISAEVQKCRRKRELKSEIRNPKSKIKNSRLYVVGTGPGSIGHITPYAMDAIERADVIVGYGTYLDLIRDLIKDKEVISTGMTGEIERCKKAVELALKGKTVSVISGGDPGIYAMAGLVFEVLNAEFKKSEIRNLKSEIIDVEVIPGIPALSACAARLGAPLMHDFAVISLSDRLTPWELIEKRIEAAAKADFVMVLYNPKSKGRIEHISKARKIILKHRMPATPVGIVKGAMRENESITISDLGHMLEHNIDMQTTVIIGNSQTFIWKKWMITPRGYEKKFKIYPE